jgi:hypothetical protein
MSMSLCIGYQYSNTHGLRYLKVPMATACQ